MKYKKSSVIMNCYFSNLKVGNYENSHKSRKLYKSTLFREW